MTKGIVLASLNTPVPILWLHYPAGRLATREREKSWEAPAGQALRRPCEKLDEWKLGGYTVLQAVQGVKLTYSIKNIVKALLPKPFAAIC